MKIKLIIALSAVQLLLMGSASAEIFKCTNNESGEIYYNDKPCPVNDTEKKMRAEKDVVGGYVPPATAKDVTKEKVSKPKGMGFSHEPFEFTDKEKSDIKRAAKNMSMMGSNTRTMSKEQEEAIAQDVLEAKTNYSERERTLEDKKILLGIRKTVQ